MDASNDQPTSSPQTCEVVCKNGKVCSNACKIVHDDRRMCMFHYNIERMSGECCSICMDDMKRHNTMKLHCGHHFHKSCLSKWVEQDKDTCPMCRAPMEPHALVSLNQSMLEYIGMVVFTLPREQRRQVLYNIMRVIDVSLAMNFSAPAANPNPAPTMVPMDPRIAPNIAMY